MNDEDKEDIFNYLTELRESGELNMYAAPAYISKEFYLSKEEAIEIFFKWTETF
jgi:hypothetical protein